MNTTAKLRLIPTAVTINVPHLDGVHRPMPAYMDNQGKLYHLVTCSGVLLAWTTQPDDDMVPCVIVEALDVPMGESFSVPVGTAQPLNADQVAVIAKAAYKEPIKVTKVIARRWFQKTYGNTYHTVEFILDNGTTYKTPRAYGYGDQWSVTAQREAIRMGYKLDALSVDLEVLDVKARKGL